MRIGIVKPDYGIAGGFEAVVDRIGHELELRGHDVARATVRVDGLASDPYGVPVPPVAGREAWEAVRYLSLLEAFRTVDTTGFDMVLSTQPPSFATPHPRHLSLFYHHLRIYYDLSEPYVAAGFAEPGAHRLAEQAVRRVDGRFLGVPRHFLAGSEDVAARLAAFHGFTDRVSILHAGSGMVEAHVAEEPGPDFGPVLCVSRHEWPKRTEIFVHAMKHLPDLAGIAVGDGGRLPFVRDLDRRLSEPGVDLGAFDDAALWLNRAEIPDPRRAAGRAPVPGNVRFTGRVADSELAGLYRDALCLVAPAYREDYGLTAIEAMAFGRPVVVTTDGGGLTAVVEDGVTGFVVEPSGAAVADAVRRLADDRGLARRMGLAARDRAAEFTWDRAVRELHDGIGRVMDR